MEAIRNLKKAGASEIPLWASPSEIDSYGLVKYKFIAKRVEGKRVLEAGCGSGYGSAILAKKAKSVVALDTSKEAIEFARRTYQRKNLKFLAGELTAVNLSVDHFDAVVACDVIEHVPDYLDFLKELVQPLKRGGLLIITTPNKYITSPNSENPVNSYHIKEFFPEEIKKLLKGYCRKVKIYGQRIIDPEFLGKKQMMLKSFIGRLRGGISLDCSTTLSCPTCPVCGPTNSLPQEKIHYWFYPGAGRRVRLADRIRP